MILLSHCLERLMAMKSKKQKQIEARNRNISIIARWSNMARFYLVEFRDKENPNTGQTLDQFRLGKCQRLSKDVVNLNRKLGFSENDFKYHATI